MQAIASLHRPADSNQTNPVPNNPASAWDWMMPPLEVRDPSIWIGRWIEGVFVTAAVLPRGDRVETLFLARMIVSTLNQEHARTGADFWPLGY